MPIPKPKKSEKKDSFIARCMSDSVMKKEYPDNKQRLAVCHTTYRNKTTSKSDVENQKLLLDGLKPEQN